MRTKQEWKEFLIDYFFWSFIFILCWVLCFLLVLLCASFGISVGEFKAVSFTFALAWLFLLIVMLVAYCHEDIE